jgi:hypothetical protein
VGGPGMAVTHLAATDWVGAIAAPERQWPVRAGLRTHRSGVSREEAANGPSALPRHGGRIRPEEVETRRHWNGVRMLEGVCITDDGDDLECAGSLGRKAVGEVGRRRHQEGEGKNARLFLAQVGSFCRVLNRRAGRVIAEVVGEVKTALFWRRCLSTTLYAI